MKTCKKTAVWLYVTNLSLLATHEMDSAYWHEWEMFQIPGGVQLFLIINLVLLLPMMYGLTLVVRWQSGAIAFSYITAGAGLFAFAIHATFMAAGHIEFRLPVSLGILTGILIVSITQIVVVARCGKPTR